MKTQTLLLAAALTLAALHVRAQDNSFSAKIGFENADGQAVRDTVFKAEGNESKAQTKLKELIAAETAEAEAYFLSAETVQWPYTFCTSDPPGETCQPYIDNARKIAQSIEADFGLKIVKFSELRNKVQEAQGRLSNPKPIHSRYYKALSYASATQEQAALARYIAKKMIRKRRWEAEAEKQDRTAAAWEKAAEAWKPFAEAKEAEQERQRRAEAEAEAREREAKAARERQREAAAEAARERMRPIREAVAAAYYAEARAWDAEADFDFVYWDGYNGDKKAKAEQALWNAEKANQDEMRDDISRILGAQTSASFAQDAASNANLHTLRAQENASDWRRTAGSETGGLRELANKVATAWEAAAQAWEAVEK